MKSYLLMIITLYILAGAIGYIVLHSLNVGSSMLIVILASVLAFFAHMYMEGVIVTDDYEPKLTFKDHLSDFKYCGFVGILVFIPSIFIGSGLSLFMSKSVVTGLVLFLIGGLIAWAGWRYTNA